MFQKYIVLFNQAKKSLTYHFSLSGRVFVLTAAFMFLLNNVAFAAPVISNNSLFYYSLGAICFITGILIGALVTASKIRKQEKRKNLTREQLMAQMEINEKRSQEINAELSTLLYNHSLELKRSTEIIQKQNGEISMLNALLKKDTNVLNLNLDVENAGKGPIMSKFVDFEAFSKIYPDKDASLKYIAGLKWSKGYACIRCSNATFLAGQTPYGRRCTKCGYDESATVNTIFHNSKILINKALYMLILVYDTKGTISSYKLAELLDIRQSTCWMYSSRFKKKLLQSRDTSGKADAEGWSQMVLDTP